jgi:hypothetical protein
MRARMLGVEIKESDTPGMISFFVIYIQIALGYHFPED